MAYFVKIRIFTDGVVLQLTRLRVLLQGIRGEADLITEHGGRFASQPLLRN